jgi:PAS domain S-box-containing protein
MATKPAHIRQETPSAGKRTGLAPWVTALVAGVIAVVSCWTAARLVYTSQWVHHTHEVVEQLGSIFSLVKDVQRGARGFVITGQEQFLKPYHSALGGLEDELAKLSALAGQDDRRRDQMLVLVPQITSALDEFRAMVDLRRTEGFESSARKVREAHGLRLMENIGDTIRTWELAEREALARSATWLAATASGARLAVVLAGVAALVRLSLAGWISRRGRQRREDEEAAWRQSEERFRLLVENLREHSVIMLGMGGHIMSWNEAAERMTGYRQQEIIGRHLGCLYAAEDEGQSGAAQRLAEAAQTGRFEGEVWYIRRDGTMVCVREVITAVREQAGALSGFIKISQPAPAPSPATWPATLAESRGAMVASAA